MTTEAITPPTGVYSSTPPAAANGVYSSTPTRKPKQDMDSEVFMNLLVTQLRNQDPSSPMDTNQIISQTTQLATMEKLTSMDKTATENFSLQMRTAAAAMIGQNISWKDADGAAHSGVADSVSFASGVPAVKVGELSVPLDVILEINSTSTTTT